MTFIHIESPRKNMSTLKVRGSKRELIETLARVMLAQQGFREIVKLANDLVDLEMEIVPDYANRMTVVDNKSNQAHPTEN